MLKTLEIVLPNKLEFKGYDDFDKTQPVQKVTIHGHEDALSRVKEALDMGLKHKKNPHPWKAMNPPEDRLMLIREKTVLTLVQMVHQLTANKYDELEISEKVVSMVEDKVAKFMGVQASDTFDMFDKVKDVVRTSPLFYLAIDNGTGNVSGDVEWYVTYLAEELCNALGISVKTAEVNEHKG